MNNRVTYNILLLLIISGLPSFIWAQPAQPLVSVEITPDHPDWMYEIGEVPAFSIQVKKNKVLLAGIKLNYTLGKEGFLPEKREEIFLEKGKVEIQGTSLEEPGFLRIKASVTHEGHVYEGMATVGFDLGAIKARAERPEDFEQFWHMAIEESREIPMDARLVYLPGKSSLKVNVYQLNFQNYRKGSRIYGILSVPSSPGKYPAVLKLPGAGVWKLGGDTELAEQDIISLEIGIHGIPLNLPAEVYENLRFGALAGYGYQGYGIEDKDHFYYKRVYLGCIRAIDFLFSMPEFDGKNLGLTGGSQGGALSMVTAALDNRVTCLAAYHPALCDLPAYLYGRAGGWPHYFKNKDPEDPLTTIKLETTAYYDVANFAPDIQVPGFYSWGFNDITCPPSSMHAAFNRISGPDHLVLYQEAGHWYFPEQQQYGKEWLIRQLKETYSGNAPDF